MAKSMIAAGVDSEAPRPWFAVAKTPVGSADRPTSAGQTHSCLGMFSYETPRIPTAGCLIQTHDRDILVALRLV